MNLHHYDRSFRNIVFVHVKSIFLSLLKKWGNMLFKNNRVTLKTIYTHTRINVLSIFFGFSPWFRCSEFRMGGWETIVVSENVQKVLIPIILLKIYFLNKIYATLTLWWYLGFGSLAIF